jgi:undecaprenyl-diphosphatase
MTLGFALGLAAGGLMSGLAWKLPPLGHLEGRIVERINGAQWPAWIDQALHWAHPLGTKWAFLAGLLLLAGLRFHGAPALGLAALSLALVERGVKLAVKRPRPFEVVDAVHMRQSFQPGDPSFPSGDAARVGFLLSASATGLPHLPALTWALLLMALLVCAGRLRLGVHYLSDVWAGSLLGLGCGALWAAL